ncbi:MAG: hypothetical protein ABIR16_03820 [Dokdonella sp.]
MATTIDNRFNTNGRSVGRHATPFTKRNACALAQWVVAAMWMVALATAIITLWRSGAGATRGLYAWLILAVIGLLGIAACLRANRVAMVSMQIDAGAASIVERTPLHSRTTRCGVDEIRIPAIDIGAVDGEGDPYFHCRLILPDGRQLDVAGSHRRCEIEAVRTRILTALSTKGGAGTRFGGVGIR